MKPIKGIMIMSATAIALPLSALANTSSADEAAITTMIESVATYADRSDFDALVDLYAPEVRVDYSSLSGEPATIKSATSLMDEWAAVLPGFDRTRHDLSDITVSLQDDTATARADVRAGHWIDGAYWEVEGHYEYAFQRQDDDWRIVNMTFTLEDETGSRDVFGPAMEAASEKPSSWMQRKLSRQVVLDFLTGLEDKDMERVNAVWADDAVQDMPYGSSVPNFPLRVVGKEALIAQYAAWPEVSGVANFTDDLRFHPTSDPQMVIAEYRGVTEIVTTDQIYDQRYIGVFKINDEGKIELFREYFDPLVFTEALGLAD